MEQHFVLFLSPGTMFAEQTTRPIGAWDVDAAVSMARTITERHGAKPYGFRFLTRAREDDELDSHIVKESRTYYLGGRVLTLADVEREMPHEETLLWNMRTNGYERIVINTNSWKWTQPLGPQDVVLDVTL